MSIHFHLKSRPAASEQRGRADAAVSALRVKTADMLSYARLVRTVTDLEDEIDLQMRTIGEMVYATHRGNPSDSEELQRILEYVDDLCDQIEGHDREMKLMRGVAFCPVCGEDIERSDVYCQKCGQPLPVENPHQT